MRTRKKAKLTLEDGAVYEGMLFGAAESVAGEVVFGVDDVCAYVLVKERSIVPCQLGVVVEEPAAIVELQCAACVKRAKNGYLVPDRAARHAQRT